MGVRVKWDLGDEPDDSALDASGIYDGDIPPKGMYRCKVMGARVKPDKNNDPRVNFWIEVQEKGKKKEYSGYRFYDGQSIAKREVQQKIWKQIAHALGVDFKAIQSKTVLDSLTKTDVEKFAGVLTEKLPHFNALCKVGNYNGDPRLEITRWLPFEDKGVSDEEEDGEDDDDEDESGDDPF